MPDEKEQTIGASYTEHPFLGQLVDAILLCELAEQFPRSGIGRHGTLCRASVATSAFSVEAAANLLLAGLKVPQFLREHADKLKITEKFEFILFELRPDQAFDRGNPRVQEIRELFAVRNEFVHPRARHRSIIQRRVSEGEVEVSKSDAPTNHLKLPRSPEDWRAADAIRVVCAASAFLDFFVIDLCGMSGERAAVLLLSRLSLSGRSSFLQAPRNTHVLARAAERWPQSFRLIRELLTTEGHRDAAPQAVQNLEIVYSHGAGGWQRPENKYTVEAEAGELSSHALNEIVGKFLVWFEEAHAIPRGSTLLMFRIVSPKDGVLVEYRTFMTDWSKTPSPLAEERPMGVVEGVSTHLFANGVVDIRTGEQGVTVIFLVESGEGRAVYIPKAQVGQLLQAIFRNRRRDWTPEAKRTEAPTVVNEQGRDYRVAGIEIFAYDPTSRTTFLTYSAESGQKVQINMRPGTAMQIFKELAGDLFGGA